MKIAIASLLVALTPAAYCQSGVGAPSDVPKDHWAYKAVDELYKLGLLVGYPDGSFKGSRPASRYELAVGISALDKLTDKDLKALGSPSQMLSTRSELDKLQVNITSLQVQLASLQPQKSDIDALKKAMAELKMHLDELKTSTEQLKNDLAKQRPS